jgi:hypothetical protein
LLAILHGHATGCPSCGWWWGRNKVESEFVGREVVDRSGVSLARATYRTIFACGFCGHRWSAEFTDEYRDVIGDQPPQRRLG